MLHVFWPRWSGGGGAPKFVSLVNAQHAAGPLITPIESLLGLQILSAVLLVCTPYKAVASYSQHVAQNLQSKQAVAAKPNEHSCFCTRGDCLALFQLILPAVLKPTERLRQRSG